MQNGMETASTHILVHNEAGLADWVKTRTKELHQVGGMQAATSKKSKFTIVFCNMYTPPAGQTILSHTHSMDTPT